MWTVFKKLTIAFLLSLSSSQALAAEMSLFGQSRDSSWSLFGQTGANHGLYSLGVEAPIRESYRLSGSVGYTPSEIGDPTYQINVGNYWTPYQNSLVGWDLGIVAHYDLSDKTYLILDEKYPDRYYPQNKLLFSATTRLRTDNFYVSLSIVDYYVDVVANTSVPRWKDVNLISVGFGLYLY